MLERYSVGIPTLYFFSMIIFNQIHDKEIKMEPTIRSGDLLAWTGTSFLSKIVRLFTMSEYTHIGIAVVENDQLYVVEAERPEVRKRVVYEETFYHIPMNIEDFSLEMSNKLHSYIGRKYSMFQAVLSLFNIYIDDSKWYCTELAYDFYTHFDISFDKRLTPTEFVSQAVKHSKTINYIESF